MPRKNPARPIEKSSSRRRAVQPAPQTLEEASARITELETRQESIRRELSEARRLNRAATIDIGFALELERRRSMELEEAYYDTILRLTRASAYKDRETGAHIQRVSHYARVLARHLGWSDDDQELVFRAAPMHDVGKIAIPDDLIRKAGSLDRGDRKVMESHTLIGASLLEGSNSRLLDMAREIALTHHEHWDGSGYPHKLTGEQIPISGRIVMLSDNYDALRSRRPYKRAFDHEATCRIMLDGDGRTLPSHFDPRLLEIFRAAHHEFDGIFEQFKDESQL
ncbi:MAG: HD domain-containing protein [Acidobacteria bacterium]|nr:HD domain-containing protein [Acidobacteriota bacterium]